MASSVQIRREYNILNEEPNRQSRVQDVVHVDGQQVAESFTSRGRHRVAGMVYIC